MEKLSGARPGGRNSTGIMVVASTRKMIGTLSAILLAGRKTLETMGVQAIDPLSFAQSTMSAP
jgi:hypothetical protein